MDMILGRRCMMQSPQSVIVECRKEHCHRVRRLLCQFRAPLDLLNSGTNHGAVFRPKAFCDLACGMSGVYTCSGHGVAGSSQAIASGCTIQNVGWPTHSRSTQSTTYSYGKVSLSIASTETSSCHHPCSIFYEGMRGWPFHS